MNKKFTPFEGMQQAKELAIQAHGSQMYGKNPYSFHLKQVVDALLQVNSESEIITIAKGTLWGDKYSYRQICYLLKTACWLHDVIEDTIWTEQDLLHMGFDELVVSIVVSMTKLGKESKVDYIVRLMQNPLAIFVKKADSFVNLQNSLLSDRKKGIEKYTENLLWLSGTKRVVAPTRWV